MAFIINDKLKKLNPYEPVCGNYDIRLDANESYIDYPIDFKSKINSAIDEIDLKRYPDPNASSLCQAFKKAYNITQAEVVAGNGSDELISVILNLFCQKGDKIAVLENDFSMYKFYATINEDLVVQIKKNHDFSINVQNVIDTINTQKCRVFIFSNPCNPTSIGLKKADVLQIVMKTEALVVVDEAYMDFWDQSILDYCNRYDNCIVLKTCSKAVALAGIRIGFAVGNKVLINSIKSGKSPYNVNAISQVLAEIILNKPEIIKENIKTIVDEKTALSNELNILLTDKHLDFTIYESVTNFIFIKSAKATEIFERLKQHSIIVRCFKNYLRITTGSKEENHKLIKALDQIL